MSPKMNFKRTSFQRFTKKRTKNPGYMKYNISIMKLMGLCPLSESAPIWKKILFYLWRSITIFSLFTFFLQIMVDLIYRREEGFLALAQNILQSVLYASATLRILFFVITGKRTLRMMNSLPENFLYSSEGIFEQESMKKITKYSNILTLIWYFSLVLIACSTPLFVALFFGKTGYLLPFPGWYPWKWQDYFFPTYVLQVFNNTILGMAFAIGDVFILSFILLTAKQWDVLGSKWKNFLNTALLQYGVPRKKVLQYNNFLSNKLDNQSGNTYFPNAQTNNNQMYIENIMRTSEFKKILDRVVLEIIADHKNLLRFCEELRTLLSPFIFMILSLSRVYLIFIVFCFTEAKNLATYLGLLQYVVGGFAQFFLYSFMGQMLITKSEGFQVAIWESPWYVCPEKVKYAVKFMLLRAEKIQILSGANMISIRIELFVTMMRETFSVYTLLKRIGTINASAELRAER